MIHDHYATQNYVSLSLCQTKCFHISNETNRQLNCMIVLVVHTRIHAFYRQGRQRPQISTVSSPFFSFPDKYSSNNVSTAALHLYSSAAICLRYCVTCQFSFPVEPLRETKPYLYGVHHIKSKRRLHLFSSLSGTCMVQENITMGVVVCHSHCNYD